MKRKNEELADDGNKKARPSEPSRALYLGNLDPSTTYYDICKVANVYGNLEFVKIIAPKKIAFVNFMDQAAAQQMYDLGNNTESPFTINDREVIVNWAKAQPISEDLAAAAAEGATRNLFLANIRSTEGFVSEQFLLHKFSQYGEIENIVVKANKGIAFVNMTSIKAAIKAVKDAEEKGVPLPGGRSMVVKFAKEHGVTARPGPLVRPAHTPLLGGGHPGFSHMPPMPMGNMGNMGMGGGGMGGGAMAGGPMRGGFGMSEPMGMERNSRAIFLGNLHNEAQYSDICALANQYGPLEWVRLNPEKGNAFLNFIESSSALKMFQHSKMQPLTVCQTPVRVGWAKETTLSPMVVEEIRQGATRNLFLGNVPEGITEGQLKEIFDQFTQGEYDSIRIIPDKKIAFVNMTNIKSAIAAKDHIEQGGVKLGEAPLKVNYAKEVHSRGRGGPGRPASTVSYPPVRPSYMSASPVSQRNRRSSMPNAYSSFGNEGGSEGFNGFGGAASSFGSSGRNGSQQGQGQYGSSQGSFDPYSSSQSYQNQSYGGSSSSFGGGASGVGQSGYGAATGSSSSYSVGAGRANGNGYSGGYDDVAATWS